MSLEEIIYECPCGQLKGMLEDDAAIFRGIVFATAERFCEPKLTESWSGIFDATIGEKDCFQFSSFNDESERFYAKEFRRGKVTVYDENQLTLNIVTPYRIYDRKMPVLIFIHGGGYETGTVGELPYGTCTEYAKEDIVFVSVGYRLNVFGLYGGDNYMLMDQLKAIEWVRNNIASFGGDPEQITLMGQSAGAMCTMDLLTSGKLAGLIKGVVMMSGAGVAPRLTWPDSKEGSKQLWDAVANKLDGDVENASPKALWEAWKAARAEEPVLKKLRHTQPSVDGVTMPQTPGSALKQGKILDVPMLIGLTSQDMMPAFMYKMAIDFGTTCDRLGHAPVYGYFFDRVLPGNLYKAFHGSDLWYMFGNLDQSWRPFEAIDYALSKRMIHNVANFCKTGKPADDDWKPITRKHKGLRHFDGVDNGMVYPRFCKKKVWRSMLREKGPI